VTIRSILIQGAPYFKLSLSEAQLEAFEQYSQAVLDWNRRLNLTRIDDPAEMAVKHFLDSLSVYPVLAELAPGLTLIDVGSGAGLPGLPLKIARPDIRLTLLEATAKKARFLAHVVDRLHLEQVTVLTSRAEEAGQQPAHRAHYDVAVARAVAALPVLAEYTLPLVRVGGLVIAQKGQQPAEEVELAATALQTLGGRISQIRPVQVPGLAAERHLVLLEKTAPTPAQYPRRPGMPAKRPL
jgi:16S rRNA (guanine527-N7)-methyltransferase